ncbi:MAG TPA: hypothetical protein VFX48_06680 [Saprospiraceae bacterium]|nr:hypothetical protein [Saprospiraceae bacterium]
MKNLLLIFSLVLVSASLDPKAYASTPSQAQAPQGRWELLGSRTVKFGLDKDEIMVTAHEGFFTGLKVKVLRSALDMHRMVVHFGDGSSQEVELKNVFRAGQESRVIDLEGNKRVITKVVFWYDTKNYKKNRAVVELYGRH